MIFLLENRNLCRAAGAEIIRTPSCRGVPIGRIMVLLYDSLSAEPQARFFLKTTPILMIFLLENRDVCRAAGAKILKIEVS